MVRVDLESGCPFAKFSTFTEKKPDTLVARFIEVPTNSVNVSVLINVPDMFHESFDRGSFGLTHIMFATPANITVLAQYRWRYWPNTASQPVLHTVFVLAWYRFTVSARYRANTGPIPGQYRFLCTGPVLAQYRISGIGPVPAQYWNSFLVLAQYRPDTGPVPICLYWPSI